MIFSYKLLNVTSEPIEKDAFNYFFLLFLPAAVAAPAPAIPSVQKAPPGWENTMAANQNCAQKLPNVTSETNRKG